MILNCRLTHVEDEDVLIPEDRKDRGSLAAKVCKLDKLCWSYRKKRWGVAVYEYAIVAPLFFLLVFGMIEYGRMVMIQQVLNNASQAGAKRAVMDDAAAFDVNKTVDDYLQSGAITGASVTIEPALLTATTIGDPVTVTVSLPFSQVSWFPSPMFLGETEMKASTVVLRSEKIE